MQDQCSIRTAAVGGSRMIWVTGALDVDTSQPLEKALANCAGEVTLDLGGVTFIDSSGLRVILSAHKRVVGSGGRFSIRDPSPPVQRILELTGTAAHVNQIQGHPAGPVDTRLTE